MCDVWSPEEHIHVHTYQLFPVAKGAKCVFSLSSDGTLDPHGSDTSILICII